MCVRPTCRYNFGMRETHAERQERERSWVRVMAKVVVVTFEVLRIRPAREWALASADKADAELGLPLWEQPAIVRRK